MCGGQANSMNGLARAVPISLQLGPLNSLKVKRAAVSPGSILWNNLAKARVIIRPKH